MKVSRRERILLVSIWIAFLLRGAFYCVQQPLWEGFDEWAHFAYIQHLAETGTLPDRTDVVSAQVQRSLLLAPLSRSAAEVVGGAVTHDAFWNLSPEERSRREKELRELRFQPTDKTILPSATQYEAQHPPLYYVVLAPVYRLTKGLSLPGQVLGLRIASLLLASSLVFVTYAAALFVIGSETSHLAVLTSALLAGLPALYINVCRVSNEGFAILTIGLFLLHALRSATGDLSRKNWFILGVAGGLALLSKAYAVALLPAILAVAAIRSLRSPTSWRANAAGAGISLATALAIGGWWYVRQWHLTGTISGEQLDASSSGLSFIQKLSAVMRMDWLSVLDIGAFSHIWVGGWSFLVVRSWMYRVCEIVAAFAALGILLYGWRCLQARRSGNYPGHAPETVVVVCFYVLMLLAVAYHALAVFLAKGFNMAGGWYLYGVAVAEVILLTVGLRQLTGRRRAGPTVAAVCLMAIALDVYTVHFLLSPYYTGMIEHRPSGPLESFRPEAITVLSTILSRLSINESPAIGPSTVLILWISYLCATVSLLLIAFYAGLIGSKTQAKNPSPASAPGMR